MPFFGCTFLVGFDSATGETDASVLGMVDAPFGSSATADSGMPSNGQEASTQDPEASPGDDGEDASIIDSGLDSGELPEPASRPTGSSPLSLTPGCGACDGFYMFNPPGDTAFTCGSEQNSYNNCDTSDAAVYQCDSTTHEPAVGYNCPPSESCWKAGTHNAACDPCDMAGDGGTHVLMPQYRNGSPPYCVTCANFRAINVNTCDPSECDDQDCPNPVAADGG